MSIDAIYVVHHSHTDEGFTSDQTIFWEMQYRFIDEALRLIDRYADNPPESRFRWTVETTCGLDAWLNTPLTFQMHRHGLTLAACPSVHTLTSFLAHTAITSRSRAGLTLITVSAV